MKNVLKYPGSKTRISDWICEFIPPHNIYLEPFFGGGAIFFNKLPSRIETINDINSDVYNYFKVLRENPDELLHLLSLTPYSREKYESSYYLESSSDVERARKFAVKCCQGFGASNKYKNGFRSSTAATSPRTTSFWNDFPEILKHATLRLKEAQIENQNALKLIPRYDHKETFMYLDPPYPLDVRKNYLYDKEMSNSEHIELLKIIKNFKGKVMISSYENDLYDSMLKGWRKEIKNTIAENRAKRTEVIYMNYFYEEQLKMF